MENRIKLKCPKTDKEFFDDEILSKRCPHCGEHIDVFSLLFLRNQKED
ncbi:MAG: hypothetical protein ISS48_02075 [Candidatus Aenigmarchaeota archaeon]|nr:hypothetical protein [Candidatus Aenigmarchaeota archaeon]